MKNVILLFKKDLKEFSYSFRKRNKKDGVVNAISSILLTALIFGVFIYVFNEFAKMFVTCDFGKPDGKFNRIGDVLTAAYLIVLVIDVIVGVRSIYNAIISAKDMDVLVYQPISARTVFVYKLIKIFFTQVFSSVLSLLPVIIVVGLIAPEETGAGYYLLSVPTMILVPMISCGIASLISVPYAFVMRFIEDKFVIRLILYVIVLGLGLWIYSKFLTVLTDLLRTGEIVNTFDVNVINKLHSAATKAYPANLFARILLGEKTGVSFAIILGVSVATFAISCVIIQRFYNRIIQGRLEGTKTAPRKKHKSKQRSVTASLLHKEFITVLRTPSYAFQYFATTVTLPFMVYVCVNLLRSLMSTLTVFNCDFELAIFVISMFSILTNTFCTTNVSRDGKMFALIRTMPVRCRDYFLAKLIFCSVVSVLSVLASTIVLAVARFINVWQTFYCLGTGILLSLAEVAYATRKDMNAPNFPQGKELAETGGNMSSLILVGLLVSVVAGGGAVALNAVLSFVTEAKYATLASVGLITLLVVLAATLAFVYFVKGMKKLYYEGGRRDE